MLKQMILRFCSTVVFIVIMHHAMLALQWFDQHSTLHFQMVFPIKKYHDGGELGYIYRILINTLVSEIRVPISTGI